jgi:hypothetical protein
MSTSSASHAGEPRGVRVFRLVFGAALVVALGPTMVRIVRLIVSGWRGGAAGERTLVLGAVLVALAVLLVFGFSLVLHAIRGTRPSHPALPLFIAIPILVAVRTFQAGGLGPVVRGEQGTATTLLLSMGVLALALAVHVVVHELGHLAAAAAAGARLESLRFGPVTVRRDGDRFRIERNRLRLAGVLGSIVAVPTKDEGFERAFGLTILGGPAATVALTTALYLGARAVSPPSSDGEAIASFVLWHATVVGGFLGVVNLVPVRLRSGLRNDGSLAWLTFRARTAGSREAVRLLVQATRGRRPREWGRDAETLVAAAETDPRYAPEVRLAALNVALDTGDVARADEIIVRGCGVDRPEDGHRQEFLLQEALLAALVRGDPVTARARLAQVGPTPLAEYPLLAHAAAALAEGRSDEARALVARWRAATERSGLPCLRVGNEWAEELLAARLG